MPQVNRPLYMYTELDAESDQQVTVVRQLLITLGHVHRRQVLSTTDRRLSLLYHTRYGGHAVSNFCMFIMRDKVQEVNTIIFGIP